MDKTSSVRRSLRLQSCDEQPNVNPIKVAVSAEAKDDKDDDDNNSDNASNMKGSTHKNIHPGRATRRGNDSSKKCLTNLKGDSSPENGECSHVEHLQTILSDKWYVENDEEFVFEVKSCCFCPKKFFSNFALKKHFDSEHKKNKLSCLLCSQTFSHEDSLRRQDHCERLLPTPMFWTPEVQEILRKCFKQEENSQYTLPQQPQRQLLQSQNENVATQVESQKQTVHPSLPTPKPQLEPLKLESETLSQVIFKIPSQIHQRKIKAPLEAQVKNLQNPCLTQQKEQNTLKPSLKRKYSCLKSPSKIQNQNIQTPSDLRSQTPMMSSRKPSPLAFNPDRAQSFSRPRYCYICKKQFSQHSHFKVHMESVHQQANHTCELCKKTFSKKGDVRRHMKSAHWGERYRCSHCTQTFSQKGSIKYHVLRTHVTVLH
ncbi:zinc finger protein 236 [Nilaparvata lugens]|uniref:zinc finger protein 236 n=1 Tax=Nilaparvata lugens TaxID=108931 RepID=UPI00193E4F5C|nr:zinc finger protein 236 [Nilaparvata lugens]